MVSAICCFSFTVVFISATDCSSIDSSKTSIPLILFWLNANWIWYETPDLYTDLINHPNPIVQLIMRLTNEVKEYFRWNGFLFRFQQLVKTLSLSNELDLSRGDFMSPSDFEDRCPLKTTPNSRCHTWWVLKLLSELYLVLLSYLYSIGLYAWNMNGINSLLRTSLSRLYCSVES